jgi:hypothetical protein
MTETVTTIQKGKKQRHQLRLPQPYFVVVDDWLEKLGEKSYLFWFKLLAKVDRTDEDKDTVKYTQAKLAKSFGISKPTLISYLKSLYEYGFIDYKEWTAPNGNVAQNIIVYEAPMNDEANLSKPLVKIRDWEKRTEDKFDFTKKGGRPKKEEKPAQEEKPAKEESKEEQQPTPVPVPNSVPKFNANVPEVVKTEFEYFKDTMESNGADLEVVVNWINRNVGIVYENAICYVLKQLATFPEPVKKTAVFITNAMKTASNFHQPITQKRPEPKQEEVRYSPRRVPFYNWLEERD